jgi:hypothetical protein
VPAAVATYRFLKAASAIIAFTRRAEIGRSSQFVSRVLSRGATASVSLICDDEDDDDDVAEVVADDVDVDLPDATGPDTDKTGSFSSLMIGMSTRDAYCDTSQSLIEPSPPPVAKILAVAFVATDHTFFKT